MYKNQKLNFDNKTRLIGIVGALIGGVIGGYISSWLMGNHVLAGIGAFTGYFVAFMLSKRRNNRPQ